MRKKEKIISMEKDRFNKNMAQMAALQHADVAAANGGSHVRDTTDTSQSSNKWVMLRNFIQQTMEKHPQ